MYVIKTHSRNNDVIESIIALLIRHLHLMQVSL